MDFTASRVIAEMTGLGTSYQTSTIRTHLAAHMIDDGSLVRTTRGNYRLARDATPGSPNVPSGTTTRDVRRAQRQAGPDGASQLASVLRSAGFPDTLHAVAAHTVMLDPSVVAQTRARGVFRTVRRDPRLNEQVGSFGDLDGLPVMFDDNLSPIAAFTWAAGHGRGVDMQFNHIWPSSRDPGSYTALWNLCATPAFLAKTTDGNNHPEVIAALRRRAFDLYRVFPPGRQEPEAPDGYDSLEWAPFPDPIDDLERAYRSAMATKPKDRVVLSVRRLGWVFSSYAPDATI